MTLYVTAVDEPIYLVPYIRRVIETCDVRVAGVAEVRASGKRSISRTLSLALLAPIVFSPGQLMRLVGFRVREAAAALGLVKTHHRLSDMCRELQVPFRRVTSANDPSFINHLKELGVDVLLNQTGELLRQPLLETPRIAVINRHLSLLPAYRGAWPIFWQFAHNEPRVGVSIHVVDQGLDTGDILAQDAIERAPTTSMAAMIAALIDRSAPLTCAALRSLQSGAPRMANSGPQASSFRTPTPGQIVRYLTGGGLPAPAEQRDYADRRQRDDRRHSGQ